MYSGYTMYRGTKRLSARARLYATLKDLIRSRGPATAQDLVAALQLPRSRAYRLIQSASRRGVIRAVAHVHTDANRRSLAWDIATEDGEFSWRRSQLIRGRYCSCAAEATAAMGVASA